MAKKLFPSNQRKKTEYTYNFYLYLLGLHKALIFGPTFLVALYDMYLMFAYAAWKKIMAAFSGLAIRGKHSNSRTLNPEISLNFTGKDELSA